MAHSPETKRLGGPAVHLAEAIFLGRRQRHVLAAIECRELAGSKMTMAVVDRVAASVSGDDQSVLPRAVEKRGQCVCFVVIVETRDNVRPKPAIALERFDIKKGADVRCAVSKDFRDKLAPRPAAYVRAILFTQPFRSTQMTKVAGGKHAAAVGDNVGVSARDSGDRQHFVDRKIRVTRAVAFAAAETLKMHRRSERVAVENRGRCIVRSGMDAKNELGHDGVRDRARAQAGTASPARMMPIK